MQVGRAQSSLSFNGLSLLSLHWLYVLLSEGRVQGKEEMATWQHHVDFIRARNACEEVMIVSAEDGAHYASAPPTFQLRSYIASVMTESGEEVEENINEAKSLINLVNNASGTCGNVPGTYLHMHTLNHCLYDCLCIYIASA